MLVNSHDSAGIKMDVMFGYRWVTTSDIVPKLGWLAGMVIQLSDRPQSRSNFAEVC